MKKAPVARAIGAFALSIGEFDVRKGIRTALALAALVACSAAAADEKGVLLESVMNERPPGIVLDIVAGALAGRRWVIEGRDSTSVLATLGHSRLRIQIDGTNLVYYETGEVSVSVGPAGTGANVRKSAANDRWLNNIRRDVTAELRRLDTARAVAPKANPSIEPQRSVTERLAELESLRASGAVSETEYSRKREEILKSL